SVYTMYGRSLRLNHALVIGVSQSGEGQDINHVLESARRSGAFTIGVTNEPASSIVNVADEVLLMHGGPERSVAATKTYTGQMLLFYMLAAALAEPGGAPDYNVIPEHAARGLEQQSAVSELVERYGFMENCVVIGRGLNYGRACELAVKLMEPCYVVAERFSSADFLHGPLAMVERHFPIMMFAPPGLVLASATELMNRLVELKADTLVITSDERVAS